MNKRRATNKHLTVWIENNLAGNKCAWLQLSPGGEYTDLQKKDVEKFIRFLQHSVIPLLEEFQNGE